MPLIEVTGLTKHFGKNLAVDDLNLTVERGEILGLLGPNGAGKTTTIRMLAGMIAPTSGKAVIDGRRTDTEVDKLHEIIGLLTETPGFYAGLSAQRNLSYFAGFYDGFDVNQRVTEFLKKVGLWERRADKVGTFSKGMKQRLAIARALLPEPEVVFLDEPTAGLDPEAAKGIRELVLDMSRQGRTVLLSTHNLAEAELLCHRIAIIHTRLVAVDTAEQLRHRFFRRQIVIELAGAVPSMLESVKKLTFVREVAQDGNKLLIELDDTEKNRPELVKTIVNSGGQVLSVGEKQYPLEEVYLKLIHEGEAAGA